MTFNSTYYAQLSNKIAVQWGGANYSNKRIILHVICSIMSFMSLLGSGYIIYDLIFRPVRGRNRDKRKLSKTFNQLLLALSISDSLSSFAMFFNTWAFPSDGIDETFFVGSAGTQGTCVAQGFLISVGWGAAVLFTACISIQYVLIVRYQITQKTLRKLQPFFFAVAIGIPLSLSVYYIVNDMLMPAGNFCFLSPYPYFCSWADEDRMEECIIQGVPNGKNMGLLAYSAYLAFVLIILLSCMITLFITVKQQERRINRWSFHNAASNSNGTMSKYVASRAYLYIAAFLFANVPALIGGGIVNHWINGLIVVLTLPLQGLLNALIYSKKIDKLLLWRPRRPYSSFSTVSFPAASTLDYMRRSSRGEGRRGLGTNDNLTRNVVAPQIFNHCEEKLSKIDENSKQECCSLCCGGYAGDNKSSKTNASIISLPREDSKSIIDQIMPSLDDDMEGTTQETPSQEEKECASISSDEAHSEIHDGFCAPAATQIPKVREVKMQ